MAYAFISYAQAKTALAQRLYNSSKTFYAESELGAYILDALQTFNALANFYRQEFVFQAANGVTWYDITNTTTAPNTLRPFTTTDGDVLSLIEYQILEPQTDTYPLAWTGSRQFAVSDILNAIQQIRDEVLSESGCTIVQRTVGAPPGRIFLNENTLDIRRVCWIPASGNGYEVNCLRPSDIWAQQSYSARFPQTDPGYPQTYRRSTEPPLSFDVDVQPGVPGDYDVLTVEAGATLSTDQATTLNIPDDWSWLLRFGTLGQLLGRDSMARDPYRAAYCAMRYQQGLQAMRMAPALLAARINDVPVQVSAVTDGDSYRANWQGETHGEPDALYYAGLNMVGLAPIPDSGIYGVTANVVSNMALPVNDGDFLQVGRDDVGAILDYAQHVAMFKCGGAEFGSTAPLYNNFIRRCTLYNSKLIGMSPWLEFIDGRSQEDDRLNPTFGAASPVTIGGAK